MEDYIDSSLENFAPLFYIFNIIGGIVLIIIGLFLVIKNNHNHKEKKKIIGIISTGIGILALFSGIIQIVLS